MWFKVFDKPITLQKIDENTEQWADFIAVHACINTQSNKEYTNSGSTRSQHNLIFELRYFKDLDDIAFNMQCYRILYKGVPFNIVNYDNYMMSNQTIKLMGTSY